MYSQTCSNDHLSKTTTRLRRPVLSPPKQIPIQSLLYMTTTCLTRPATTFFFISQMKKKLSKTTATKRYQAKKWETIIWKPCIINISPRLYLLYRYFIMQSLFNVFKNWTFALCICLLDYIR